MEGTRKTEAMQPSAMKKEDFAALWKSIHLKVQQGEQREKCLVFEGVMDYLSFLTLRVKNCPAMPNLDRQDYIIAESGNVLLICKREDEQRIKQFVADAQMKYEKEFN